MKSEKRTVIVTLLPTTVRTRSHFGTVATDFASTSLNRHDKGSKRKGAFKYAVSKVASDFGSLLTGAVPRFWNPGLSFAVVNLARLSSKCLKFFNFFRSGAVGPDQEALLMANVISNVVWTSA